MSRRDDTIPLGHMLSHAKEAIDLCKGVTRDEFDSNRLLNLAVVRLLDRRGISKSSDAAHARNHA